MFGFLAALAIGGVLVAMLNEPKKAVSSPAPSTTIPGVLEYDLTANWGVIPQDLRRAAVLAELASGLPGLARPLAAYWWSVWRGNAELVDLVEAAELAAKGPSLCQSCFTTDGRSGQELQKLIASGYPKPMFQAGWAAGSFGLGQILGATAVYAGAEDARVNGKWQRTMLPLIDLEPDPAMQRQDVQAWLGAVLVWRALLGTKTPTIASDGPNTWGNVFSAISDPTAYNAGQGLLAKARYLQRADEAGIDLSIVPAPISKPGPLRPTRVLWVKLQALKDLPFVNIGAEEAIPEPGPPPPLPPPLPPPPKIPPPDPVVPVLPIMLAGGISALQLEAATQPADAAAPMVVLLHGRDGDVKDLEGLIAANLPARVFSLRGPIASKGGRFRFMEASMDGPTASTDIRKASALVGAAVRDLLKTYPTTRLVLVGYDQGGAIALRLATIGMADLAVGIGTMLPSALYPVRPSQAGVIMVHGTEDPWTALATLDAFAGRGFSTAWRSVDGAGHALEDLVAAAREELNVAFAQLPQVAPAGFSWSPECKLEITDLGASMRFLIPQLLNTAAGGPLTPEQLAKTSLDQLAMNDANCVFPAKLVPVNPDSAVKQYLLERQVLITLMTRGQIPSAEAVALVTASRNTAASYGAPAADLPQIEI